MADDIDTRLGKLEITVWRLEHELSQAQRVIDLLLINDPECEVTKCFVKRAKQSREHREVLKNAQEKIRDMRGEIERLLNQHPELRKANETRC